LLRRVLLVQGHGAGPRTGELKEGREEYLDVDSADSCVHSDLRGVSVFAKYIIRSVLPTYKIMIVDYEGSVQILLALAFGYLIVSAVARFFYWSTVVKYGHSTAAAVRDVVRIVGIGAMVAAISGGVAGGAAGVALGGFLGMVVGFASQQVLGQASGPSRGYCTHQYCYSSLHYY